MRLVRRALMSAAACLALGAMFTGVALGHDPEADDLTGIDIGLVIGADADVDLGADVEAKADVDANVDAAADVVADTDATVDAAVDATVDAAVAVGTDADATVTADADTALDVVLATSPASGTIRVDATIGHRAGRATVLVGIDAGLGMLDTADAAGLDASAGAALNVALGDGKVDTTADVAVILGTRGANTAADAAAAAAATLDLGGPGVGADLSIGVESGVSPGTGGGPGTSPDDGASAPSAPSETPTGGGPAGEGEAAPASGSVPGGQSLPDTALTPAGEIGLGGLLLALLVGLLVARRRRSGRAA